MVMAQITPTPWPDARDFDFVHEPVSCLQTEIVTDNGGSRIANFYGPDRVANAALVVTAVNSHADMLAALKAAFYQIAGLELASKVSENGWKWPEDSPRHVHMTAETIRAAIAKAEGRS